MIIILLFIAINAVRRYLTHKMCYQSGGFSVISLAGNLFTFFALIAILQEAIALLGALPHLSPTIQATNVQKCNLYLTTARYLPIVRPQFLLLLLR